jgi:CBS domain-containing protein
MTSPAIVVGPVQSLTTVAKLMDAERVKRAPVVDGYGQLVGIVSRRDLLRTYLRDGESIRTEIVQEVLLHTLWIQPETLTVTVDQGAVSLAGTWTGAAQSDSWCASSRASQASSTWPTI